MSTTNLRAANELLCTYPVRLVTPSMVEEALGLAEEFAGNTDDLSVRSIRWIVETAEEAQKMAPEGRDLYLAMRVYVLVTEILVDMIFRPLRDPVIDLEGVTWSRGSYELYRDLLGISPVGPHTLAVRMISLVQPLLPQPSEGAVTALDERQVMEDFVSFVNAQAARENRKITRVLQKTTADIGTLASDLQQQVGRAREESEREAAEDTAQVRRRLDTVGARFRAENEQLRTDIQAGEAQLGETEAELRARKGESRDLGHANRALRSEVGQLQNQVQQQYSGSRCGAGDWCVML